MVSADEARNIVGIVGNVIAFCLFLSPVPTFYKICKKKEVEDYSPIPYIVTFFNCMMWIFYGLPFVTPDSLLVITINGCGLVLEGIYLIIFIIYATNAGRRMVLLYLLGEVVFMASVVVGVMLGAHTHKKRSLIVGVLCVIIGTCMYAAPLAAMKNVITTKSVQYMPLPLSLASFLNGVAWTAYALIRFDIFITIPNGLGTLLAIAQLILYCCYCGNTSEAIHEPGRSEVQLSAAEEGRGRSTPAPTSGRAAI